MDELTLKGKKFISPLRCSEEEQVATSIPQQRGTCTSFAAQNEMEIVRFVEMPAKSATIGEQVEMLQELIRQKIDGEDFDGLLFDAYSRFVRSDVDSARLYADARDANLLIVTVKEGLMMGPGSWAKRDSASDQSEGYARDISRNVNRGVTALILAGLIPPVNLFTFGVDRLYYDKHGTEVFRVRRLSDGSKVVLDPRSPFTVRYAIPKEQRRLHLRPDGGRYEYAPGDEQEQGVVRWMFRKWYLDGWRAYRIARDLNIREVKNFNGTEWNVSAVQRIIRNPLYLGDCVGFKFKAGKFGERQRGMPKMFAVERRPGFCLSNKTKRRKRIPAKVKKPEEWFIAEQKLMTPFLEGEPDVLLAARQQWEDRKKRGWPDLSDADRGKRIVRRRKSFLLTHILKIKSDSQPMVGSSCRKNKDAPYIEYYITYRDNHTPKACGHVERIRADVVDNEVLSALSDVLRESMPSLGSSIAQIVAEQKRSISSEPSNTEVLATEKSQLESWYRSVFSVAGQRGRALLADEGLKAERRLEELDFLISKQTKKAFATEDNVDAIITSVRRQFSEMETLLKENSKDTVRNLIETLVSNLTFDPESRQIEIDFALPSWAISSKERMLGRVSRTETDVAIGFTSANTEQGIPLLSVICVKETIKHKGCLVCHRLPRLGGEQSVAA